MAEKLAPATGSLRYLIAESATERLLRDAVDSPFSRSLQASLDSPMSRALEVFSDAPMTRALERAIDSPLSRALEQANRQHEQLIRNLTAIKPFELPKLPDFVNEILRTNAALDKHWDEMRKATRIFDQMAHSFDGITNVLRSQSEVARQFESITRSMTLPPPLTFPSDLLSVTEYARQVAQEAEGHLAVTLAEIEAQLHGNVTPPVAADGSLPVPVVIRTGIEWIDRLPPAVQVYIIPLLIHLLVGFIIACTTQLLLRESADRPMQVVLQEFYPSPEDAPVEGLRCVLGDSVRVHDSLEITSKTIGQLEKGQGVEIGREEGDWSLVRYYPRGSEEIATGWVSSAYLSRVICSD